MPFEDSFSNSTLVMLAELVVKRDGTNGNAAEGKLEE
jgi:hypothetical protein